jgi:uncharacterized protein DUF4157/lysine-specific metallo-endopeptidase family protein
MSSKVQQNKQKKEMGRPVLTRPSSGARDRLHAAPHPQARLRQLQRSIGNQRVSRMLQKKLVVGPAGDEYEREADRVAEAVTSESAQPSSPHRFLRAPEQAAPLQRKCSCGGTCSSCQEEEGQKMQRKGSGLSTSSQPVNDAPIVDGVLRSPGQPLDPATRAYFEPRFGHDFSQVRIHTDARAAESARSVNALAYTVGRDIVFESNQHSPGTDAGRRLLAHELTHTVQQSGAAAKMSQPRPNTALPVARFGANRGTGPSMPLMRQTNPGTPTTGTSTSSPATPSYGASCSGGAQDPCQQSRCTSNQTKTIAGDVARAIGYVNTAIAALGASPLASNTASALDWYFRSSDPQTAAEVKRRLACIKSCLIDTQSNSRFGCHPDDPNTAYVCVGTTPICLDAVTQVCVTDLHFGQDPRERAETIIHECAHRIGMSLGTRTSVPDIYVWSARFRNLDTSEALQNSDSLAGFAGAITGGIRLTVLPLVGLSGGAALPASGGGAPTWQARLYLGAEFQHPVLSVFNPTVGIGFSVIGNPAVGTSGIPVGPSLLASLLAGIRIANPRPGAAGGPYLSLFGGPALVYGGGKTGLGQGGVGAEAGVGLGYRWRWLDVSVSTGIIYDPTRVPGAQNLVPVSGAVTATF